MAVPKQGDLVELEVADIAHGGEGVGRVEGKAHFIAGALPGETVIGRIVKDGGSWARADLVEVRRESPDRVAPPCPHAETCGGCQWQHAAYPAQLRWKRNTVVTQLSHIGRITDPPVAEIVAPGPQLGYRNRMDFRVAAGRPALNRARSHDAIPLDVCEILEPQLAATFFRFGDLSGATRITLRGGTFTGEQLAIVEGEIPESAASWGIPLARQEGRRVVAVEGPARIHERIGDTRFRVTGSTFFQNNSHGAATLVDLVAKALDPSPGDSLLDAYAGVGLFGACLAPRLGRVVAVESNRVAVDDLRFNLQAAGVDHRVIRGKMEAVADRLDEYPSLIVADPPRTGLSIEGAAALVAPGARRIAYVSCDPASLARDTVILAGYGYSLEEVTPVDMFPQTYHIEAVATFGLT